MTVITPIDQDAGYIAVLEKIEHRVLRLGALVAWTSNDPAGPAAAGRETAEEIRSGRFEHITSAGHWPKWEQRDVFNTLVLGFLAEEAP